VFRITKGIELCVIGAISVSWNAARRENYVVTRKYPGIESLAEQPTTKQIRRMPLSQPPYPGASYE